MLRNSTQWFEILVRCQVKPVIAQIWAVIFAKVVGEGTFSKGDAEIDDFLGQILHESSGLTQFTESLNYSVTALLSVFGRHRISESDARLFGRIDGRQQANQQAIANCLYGGAWGAKNLGNVYPGDGWRYRGRTPLQVTGRANYELLGRLLGLDLLSDPDQLNAPEVALRCCILWWEKRIPDSMIGDIERVTRVVNGGLIGLADRQLKTELAGGALQ